MLGGSKKEKEVRGMRKKKKARQTERNSKVEAEDGIEGRENGVEAKRE